MSQMKLNVGVKGWKNGSNILDLSVPAQLEDTYQTGLSFFDDALGSGDGITPSSSILFTGTPGAGKTTMCLQLANAITKAGHICLYNTGEESLFQVRKVVKRLDLRAGFVAGQDTLVSDVLAHAGLLMKQNPGKKVFMICDSLQTLNDGKYADGAINSMTQVRVTEMITDFCKETYATALIVGQVTKSGDFGGKMQVKHTVDVHAHLFLDENKKSETYGERIFEVQKNRFGCGNRSYVLGIGKQGLYEKGQIQTGNF